MSVAGDNITVGVACAADQVAGRARFNADSIHVPNCRSSGDVGADEASPYDIARCVGSADVDTGNVAGNGTPVESGTCF